MLKCLEKWPARRYASAADLASDLDAVLHEEPVSARRPSSWSRVARFLRRHPVGAGALAAAVFFLVALATASTAVASAQEREMRSDEMTTNAWVARATAGAVVSELRTLADVVERASHDPVLVRALEEGTDLEVFKPPLTQPFDSMLVLDTTGRWLARWPSVPERVGTNYGFRSYFRGAVDAHAAKRGHAVSRAYRSEATGTFRFAISAPVTSSTGSLVGVIVGSVETDSALGSIVLHLDAPTGVEPTDRARVEGDRRAMIVALRDRDRGEEADSTPIDWVVLLDEAIAHPGEEVFVKSRVLDALAQGVGTTLIDRDHVDPRRPGRWLAGFASVPETPWVVIVETREDAAVARNVRLSERVRRAAFLAGLLGLAVGAASFLLARGRLRAR
jgi:hypothetical protein